MPDPIGNVVKTSCRQIARALKDRAQLHGVCSDAQFRMTVRDPDDVEPLEGAFDVLFVLGAETTDDRLLTGAGRNACLCHRSAKFVCRTKLLLDQVGEDESRLFDPDDGHVKLEDSVFNAFQLFQPTTEAGDWLVSEPIRLPRLTKARPLRRFPDWIMSEVECEFSYVRSLDTSIT